MNRLFFILSTCCLMMSSVVEQTYTFTSGLPLNDISGTGTSVTLTPTTPSKAKENSTQRIAYSLTDETPLRGLSYYRLSQVDLDGTSHTYPAVSIRTEGTDALYPNPSNGTFVNLDVAATSTIELFTLTGKNLSFDRKIVSESSVQLLPKNALTPGLYLSRVNGITRKWVVQ